MNRSNIFRIFCVATTMLFFSMALCMTAKAQRRDYLTDAEVDLVRDAQEIDRRVHVLTKAIDRRFLAMNVDVAGQITREKENKDEDWGPAPTGTRVELLFDIKRLLQKAVDDIDDVAENRPSKQNKAPISADDKKARKEAAREAARFPNAVKLLAASAQRYLPALRSELDKDKDEKAKGSILSSIEFCNEIIEASTKLSSDQVK